MSGPAEILCSRCGTPFPKEKGKAGVTCVVCGQLRPDLDLTLDDDDDDLGAALGSSSGGSASAAAGSGGGFGGEGGGSAGSAAPATDSQSHVLRVASAGTGSGTATPPPLPAQSGQPARAARNTPPRLDQPYMALDEGPARPVGAARATGPGDRLLERVGTVLLVVCPLAAGMAGGLNMLSRTEDFSTGTWYAVGAVFAVMVVAALLVGLVAAGLLHLVRVRWTILLRIVFIAAAGAVCYYGVNEVPSHVQVRSDGLPGFVLRK